MAHLRPRRSLRPHRRRRRLPPRPSPRLRPRSRRSLPGCSYSYSYSYSYSNRRARARVDSPDPARLAAPHYPPPGVPRPPPALHSGGALGRNPRRRPRPQLAPEAAGLRPRAALPPGAEDPRRAAHAVRPHLLPRVPASRRARLPGAL